MEELARIKIGKEIKASRIALSMSLNDVAVKMGTSPQNIARYEKGDYKKPDHELLSNILNVLGIDKSILGNNGLFDLASTLYSNKSGENLKVEKSHLLSTEPKNWVDEKIKHLEEVIKLKNELIEELRRNK